MTSRTASRATSDLSLRPPADCTVSAAPAGLASARAAAAPSRARNGILKNSSRFPMALPLAQELAVAADDRQVDEFRTGMVFLRVADVKTSDVDVVHALQGVYQPFARRILARALQAFDHHLRGDEAFHRAEVEVGESVFGSELLVFPDHRYGAAPRKWHDLRNRHAAAFGAERIGERLAANEGHVVERRPAARFLHLPYEFRARGIRAHHDDRVGLGRIDGFHRVCDLDGVALHRAARVDFQPPLGKRHLRALAPRFAVAIRLVEDRDVLAAGRNDLLDDFLGFIVVARAHVEYVAVERRAQHFRTGEHSDQRHLRLRHHWQVRHAGRRSDIAEQREDLVLLNELAGRGRRERGLVMVVLRYELEPTPVHAALRVHIVEVLLDAIAHLNAELRGRSAEHRRLAEYDFVGGDAVFGRGAERCNGAGERKKAGERALHELASRKAALCSSAATSSSFQMRPSPSLYWARTQGTPSLAGCDVR